MKIIELDPKMCYIIFADPHQLDFSVLAKTEFPFDKDVDCIIIPVTTKPGGEIDISAVSIDSKEVILRWLSMKKEIEEIK